MMEVKTFIPYQFKDLKMWILISERMPQLDFTPNFTGTSRALLHGNERF